MPWRPGNQCSIWRKYNDLESFLNSTHLKTALPKWKGCFGTPGGIRTHGLPLRSSKFGVRSEFVRDRKSLIFQRLWQANGILEIV